MNLKHLCILLLTSSLPMFCLAQETLTDNKDESKLKFSTRIGLNSFVELNLYADYQINSKNSLSMSIGYNHGARIFPQESGFFCASKSYNEIFARRGIKLQFGIKKLVATLKSNKLRKKDKLIYTSILVLYRNNKTNEIEIYEGCFSGSGNALTLNFDASSQDFGLMSYIDFLKGNPKIDFYFGLGISRRWQIENVKTIPPNSSSSNIPFIETKFNKNVFLFDLGFKINVFNSRN